MAEHAESEHASTILVDDLGNGVAAGNMFELPNDILALVAIATVLLTLSTRRINKRLD